MEEIKNKIENYETKKVELLKLAVESDDSMMVDVLNNLSLDKPNVLWDKLNSGLNNELLFREIANECA